MRKLLYPGRRIWLTYDARARTEVTVLKYRRVLPAGPVASGEPHSYDSIRGEHLIQIYTDPGGMRTLTVAQIHLKDPGRKRTKAAT